MHVPSGSTRDLLPSPARRNRTAGLKGRKNDEARRGLAAKVDRLSALFLPNTDLTEQFGSKPGS